MKNVALIRKHFRAFIAAHSQDVAAAEALVQQRAGTYTHAVRAAIAADGDDVEFGKACDEIMDMIRSNTDDMAIECGAQLSARPAADGSQQWRVPSGVSAAKSMLMTAMQLGVPLTEGARKTPRAYNAIRTDVIALRAEASLQTETRTDTQRREVRAAIKELLKRLRRMDEETLDHLHAMLMAEVEEAGLTIGGPETTEAEEPEEEPPIIVRAPHPKRAPRR